MQTCHMHGRFNFKGENMNDFERFSGDRLFTVALSIIAALALVSAIAFL